MNICDIINTSDVTCILNTNKFGTLTFNKNAIYITLTNILLPFGCEKFNDNLILNIELENNNINNNILSKLENLEENLKNQKLNSNLQTTNNIKNKGFVSMLKKSKLGNIIRTHILKNSEIFIKKKDGEKMIIDYTNLQNTNCNINALIQGFWINNNTYGLYIIVNNIEVLKFN
jgi:hypothetical protein